MAKMLRTEQLVAIHYLAQPKRGGKTMEDIAKECGVDRTTLYNWMKDESFDKELKRQVIRESMSRVPEVIESMADAAVKDHNAAAAKLILQVNQMLIDQMSVETKTGVDTTDINELQARIAQYKQRKQHENGDTVESE